MQRRSKAPAPYRGSPTAQLQFESWVEVREALDQSGEFPSLRAARGQYWFDIAIGRAYVNISLIANSWGKMVGVRLYMNHRVASQVLEQLMPQRERIEQEIGDSLEWNPHPDKMDKIIRLNRDGDIADRTQWPELAEWLTRKAVAFKRAFGPRLAGMDLSPKPTDIAGE